jgi:hypothetical protein
MGRAILTTTWFRGWRRRSESGLNIPWPPRSSSPASHRRLLADGGSVTCRHSAARCFVSLKALNAKRRSCSAKVLWTPGRGSTVRFQPMLELKHDCSAIDATGRGTTCMDPRHDPLDSSRNQPGAANHACFRCNRVPPAQDRENCRWAGEERGLVVTGGVTGPGSSLGGDV